MQVALGHFHYFKVDLRWRKVEDPCIRAKKHCPIYSLHFAVLPPCQRHPPKSLFSITLTRAKFTPTSAFGQIQRLTGLPCLVTVAELWLDNAVQGKELGHVTQTNLCTLLWPIISFSLQMRPRRTSQKTLTLTWKTRRLRRRLSPSSPSSGSSRRRSVLRSPSERHVALPLCVETAGGSDGTVTMVWHLHVNKFIPVGTPGVVMGLGGRECNSLFIIWQVCDFLIIIITIIYYLTVVSIN